MFDEIKRYIGFGQADVAHLRALAAHIKPSLPRVIDRFYEQLLQHPSARSVFTGGEEQMDRQKAVLLSWMMELFDGDYETEYCLRRLRIGTTHVRVGLQQRYMFLGMELIWQELSRFVRQVGFRDADVMLSSLHKLLMLDLTLMVQSYKDAYSDEIRLSERTVVEERLTKAEHLAEIGHLAASLAHEIKNPLAGISGAMQIIRDDLPANDPHQPIITEILAQIHRLDAAVKDLLLYARPTPPRAREFQLADTVRRTLMILEEEPTLRHLRVEFLDEHLDARVFADDGQIEQLVINLLINAAHASNHGGRVCVSINVQDERIRLGVQDFGKGMTPEVLRRAFEPFFTTKARGTGLGLSICRRIVETNGGVIHLESAPGRGTSVFVDFPRRRMKAEQKG